MTIENAMVLAAGLGTRMRPITDTIPKPLVEIAGKPLIDYALDALREAGVRRAVVNVHYRAEQMEAHLGAYSGLEILISDERAALLNSGGGLVKGLTLLPEGPVFVMNADLFWVGDEMGEAGNLGRLARFFDPATMDMAMLLAPTEKATGHDGGDDFKLIEGGGLIRAREATPETGGQGVIYAGAIALDSRLFTDAPKGAFNLNLYFDRAIKAGRLKGLLLDGDWATAGTPEAIAPAEAVVRRHRASP
jgi:MurNAc alpha-1-phosphate uridylyltransferase